MQGMVLSMLFFVLAQMSSKVFPSQKRQGTVVAQANMRIRGAPCATHLQPNTLISGLTI